MIQMIPLLGILLLVSVLCTSVEVSFTQSGDKGYTKNSLRNFSVLGKLSLISLMFVCYVVGKWS